MGIKKKVFQLPGKKLGNIFIFILLLTVSYFIYKPALTSYFFQDDWFTLKISQVNSISDILSFFIPRTDVIYYRPLGMQLYFSLMQYIFGINQIPFRISTLLIYSFNGLLIYKIFKKLEFTSILSLFAAILFCASVVTYIPFYWSSTFPFVLGPTFFLLAFKASISNYRNNQLTAILFFILGLITLESIIFLPVLVFIWNFIFHKKYNLKAYTIYLIAIIIYFSVRTIFFPVKLNDTYSLYIKPLASLRAYSLWSLNWPEEINRQFIGVFKLNPDFINDFSQYLYIWIVSSVGLLLMLIVIPILLNLVLKRLIDYKTVIFGVAWYGISLFPLLMFSNHTFPYYLPIALTGLLIFFFSLLKNLFSVKAKPVLILYLLVISFLWINSSFTTVQFNLHTHWAPKRAQQSYEQITSLKISQDNKYYLNREYKYALNDQDALKVTLKNENVQTIYIK